MNLHPNEEAFLQELAREKSAWTEIAVKAIEDPGHIVWSDKQECWKKVSECITTAGAATEFRQIISEVLSGLVHSTLVSLDGGSVLADTTLLRIQDDTGYEFKRFLHEYWPEYSEQTNEQA